MEGQDQVVSSLADISRLENYIAAKQQRGEEDLETRKWKYGDNDEKQPHEVA